jgi:hypothetical protein
MRVSVKMLTFCSITDHLGFMEENRENPSIRLAVANLTGQVISLKGDRQWF